MIRSLRWPACLLASGLSLLSLAAPAAAKDASDYHLFVWKVTAPGAAADAKSDYLIGTMHLPVGDGKTMPRAVRALIAASSHVVTEVDTKGVTPELIAKYAMLKGDKNLQQLLPPAAWQKLVKAAQPLGLPSEQLKRMEPWFLTLGLGMPAPEGAPAIDELIQEEAVEGEVGLGYLETADEQLKMLDSIRQDEDVSQLLEALDAPGKGKELVEELKAAYFAGDTRRVETLTLDAANIKRYPDFYAKLIFDRNARWMPKVERLFADEDAVVAVGLAHLLGKQGLVSSFQAKGYRVEPLPL